MTHEIIFKVTSANVIFPLAELVESLLKEPSDLTLVERLRVLINHSQVIWKPDFGRHKIVLDCGSGAALKVIQEMKDTTEYTILQFLEQHLPSVPAPRPFGLVEYGELHTLFFLTLIPLTTLEAVWAKLDHQMKCSVQHQLNNIFMTIRSFQPLPETAFGGVAGEGCKDLRRHVRITKEPIYTVEQFDDWQFSNPHFGSAIYIQTLRRLSPPLPSEIVLSHDDLRPDNIMVEYSEGEQCRVTGIIDWQYSGFYPVCYEAIEVMNPITPNEESDWFPYIPEYIADTQQPQKVLLDALWWKCVE